MATTPQPPEEVQNIAFQQHQHQQQQQQQQQKPRVQKPEVRWFGHNKYVGELKDGRRHGRGLIKYSNHRGPNGEEPYYFGDWEDDKISGKGIRHLISSTYEGDWFKGQKHGRGTLQFHDEFGERYEGDWKNDQRVGYGRISWSNGAAYEGDWKNGMMTGKGTYWWPIGDRYEGDWLDDLQHGHGILYWKDGSTYEGDFVKDNRCGRGTYRMIDGRYLIGTYDNDMRCGEAVFRWPNGDHWVGTFSDMTHAEGCKTIAATNDRITGKWVGLALENGDGEMLLHQHRDGTVVKGTVVNDVFIVGDTPSSLSCSTSTTVDSDAPPTKSS